MLDPLKVPSELKIIPHFSDESNICQWERDVFQFLTPFAHIFTPFPNYFSYRGYLFQMMRQLLPEYFNKQYDLLLEIGCGLGFHSLLLRPYSIKQIGVDLPGKYIDYVRDPFSSSPEMASYLVNNCFNAGVVFHEAFPHQLSMLNQNSVDFLFSWCTLEHIPNLSLVAQEWRRILKPGGIMVHVAPTIMNEIVAIILANIINETSDFSLKNVINCIQRLAKTKYGGGMMLPGQLHSEFAKSVEQQISIYTANNYIVPFLMEDFRLERIQTIRDFENAIIMRKAMDK